MTDVQRIRISSVAVHMKAMQTHLVTRCMKYSWASKALGMIRARDYKRLVVLAKDVDQKLMSRCICADSEDPAVHRSDAASFLAASQFVALVLKYPYTDAELPGNKPDEAALEALLKTERRNARVNNILRAYRARGRDPHPAFAIMRKYIASVVGPKPDFNEIYEGCDFSGGATYGVGGKATHFGNKVMAESPDVTPTALKYYKQAVWSNEQLRLHYLLLAQDDVRVNTDRSLDEMLADRASWSTMICFDFAILSEYLEKSCRLVPCNKISCVPKKFDRSRTIAAEPTMNGFLQKGVDKSWRERLRRIVGINLEHQSPNQVLAFYGSLRNHRKWATLDVRDASACQVIELVRSLFSEEWFSFLNDIRSPAGEWPDGTVRRYQMFCSMGNGFCFPLETLIFASICHAAYKLCNRKPEFRVYGDDMIVDADIALLVIEILKSCGFRMNLDKTFMFGPFRESCGANWYEGYGVTPVYWRKRITCRSELFHAHNAHEDNPQIQEALRAFDSELPYCVPDNKMYRFVTDQAFRVPMDVCLASTGAVWRPRERTWFFQMLTSNPVMDENCPNDYLWDNVRTIASLRGATYAEAFPLRKSVFYKDSGVTAKSAACHLEYFVPKVTVGTSALYSLQGPPVPRHIRKRKEMEWLNTEVDRLVQQQPQVQRRNELFAKLDLNYMRVKPISFEEVGS